MWGRLYWVVTGLMLAIAVYAGYLLVAPGFALERNLRKAGLGGAQIKFEVLNAAAQTALFPTYPPSSVFGLCAYDVAAGPVQLKAALPNGFWTLTVYSQSGNVIYALNSRQSGTNTFTVTLKRAPGLLESITRATSDDPQTFSGWTVATPSNRGVAVLWMPLSDMAERPATVAALGASACHAGSG